MSSALAGQAPSFARILPDVQPSDDEPRVSYSIISSPAEQEVNVKNHKKGTASELGWSS